MSTGSSAAVTRIPQIPDLLVEESYLLGKAPDPRFMAAQFVAQLHADKNEEHDGDEEEKVHRLSDAKLFAASAESWKGGGGGNPAAAAAAAAAAAPAATAAGSGASTV